jgi:hypothetical protein
MPLFICDQCHAIENTALGSFWHRRSQNLPVLCSECGRGKWHGHWPKAIATKDTVRERKDDFMHIPKELCESEETTSGNKENT